MTVLNQNIELSVEFNSQASPFGFILAAHTAQGKLCAIFWDNSTQFPTRAVKQNKQLNDHLAKLVAYVEQPRQALTLPLTMKGTLFQKRVWKVLLTIPLGKTSTYTEVAQCLGAPNATRAVAGACALNNLSILIPCHRVISKTGTLSGYRWGIIRKKFLLEKETFSHFQR